MRLGTRIIIFNILAFLAGWHLRVVMMGKEIGLNESDVLVTQILMLVFAVAAFVVVQPVDKAIKEMK